MIERHLIVPVVPETLWEALTDPQEVGAWFGHHVEWELTPGAPARWTKTDGAGAGEHRVGVVQEVAPARRLKFRWWPETDDGPASEVTYDLEPAGPDDPESTHLTVREAPLPERPAPSARSGVPTKAAMACWDVWDTRHAGLWIRLHSTLRVDA